MVHTGNISVPAAGLATISLGSTVRVRPGDWFSIACTDNTASFTSMTTTSGPPLQFGTGQLFGASAANLPTAPPLQPYVQVQNDDQGTPWVVLI